MLKLIRARRKNGEKGQALVEFTLLVPIFLLLLFAIIDFGMGFYSWITVTNAAREGARLGAVLATQQQIEDGAEGVILTHGTDTMHYTSAALSFMLQHIPCPIILTGSQRSSDRGSSDAESNMRASLIAARLSVP